MSGRRDRRAVVRRHAGLTLVELMVAMVIGLFIFAAVMAIFMRNTVNYHTTNSTARLQENARAAMNLIGRDLRLAGYGGCQVTVGEAYITLSDVSDADAEKSFYKPVAGTESCPAIGNCSASDSLTVTFLDPAISATLTAAMGNTGASLAVSTPNLLQKDDIVGVSNCLSLDIAAITDVQDSGATLLHAIGAGTPSNARVFNRTYATGATVMKLTSIKYEVKTGATGESTLFRDGQEMIDGVENMQVRFGEWNPATNTTSFVTANNVSNWWNIISIEVGLLLNSVADTASGEYGNDPNSTVYTLLGTNIAPPAERRIRKTFVSTFKLRNLPRS